MGFHLLEQNWWSFKHRETRDDEITPGAEIAPVDGTTVVCGRSYMSMCILQACVLL